MPAELEHLFMAAERLEHIVRIWQRTGVRMPHGEQVSCFNAFLEFCDLVRCEEELDQMPKKHQFLHLLKDISWHGNPRWYSNWYDEHLNKLLKASCRLSAQSTLETAVLLRMRELLTMEYRKRKDRTW